MGNKVEEKNKDKEMRLKIKKRKGKEVENGRMNEDKNVRNYAVKV